MHTISWFLATQQDNDEKTKMTSEDYFIRRQGKHTKWTVELKTCADNRSLVVLRSHDLRFASAPMSWARCTITNEQLNCLMTKQYYTSHQTCIVFNQLLLRSDECADIIIEISFAFDDDAVVTSGSLCKQVDDIKIVVDQQHLTLNRRPIQLWTKRFDFHSFAKRSRPQKRFWRQDA